MNAEGMTLLAGGVAFTGNFKKESGFPKDGYKIVAATLALTFVYSLAGRGKLSSVVNGLAALTLLASVMYYTPIITSMKKRKRNG